MTETIPETQGHRVDLSVQRAACTAKRTSGWLDLADAASRALTSSLS